MALSSENTNGCREDFMNTYLPDLNVHDSQKEVERIWEKEEKEEEKRWQQRGDNRTGQGSSSD